MEMPIHILLTYGYFLLFVWILVEQLGAPLPSTPLLLSAGALTAQHQMSFWLAVLAGLTACILADGAWFFVGRRYGSRVVKILCKLSLEPTTCVRKTQSQLGVRRIVTLLFAKFIPGVATVSPPLAGQSGMSYGEFLFLDGLGSLMWVVALLEGGRLFGDALKRDPSLLDTVGRFSGLLLVLGIVGFIIVRVWRRQRTLRRIVATRMEPEELKRMLDAGETVYIVDLRSKLELVELPFTLPGARLGADSKPREWVGEIPHDASVVVFCACPGELTAAKTAVDLQKLGVEGVRPLRGGYDAWQKMGYPVIAVEMEPAKLVQIEESSEAVS